ncbi:hypothetical protein ACFQLX_05405 [Streptomyces polyrhachis]|uniref:Uncharacterized protein n=1 Tax=Streptomyces polyrhachis TaxID=1282885 RepID=A0ABW2G9Y1_9ACTN
MTCSPGSARRDRLLLNHARNVWIICRCSHQWLEPELTRADFDALVAAQGAGTTYPAVARTLATPGFDGVLAGACLQ